MKKIKSILILSLCSCLGFAQSKIIYSNAGTGVPGYSGDGGFAANAKLNYPSSVAVDGYGNTYIADYENFRIRKVSVKGIITTIAGTGVAGYNGDGIAATSAKLSGVFGLSLDGWGNIYFSDRDGVRDRVRKITVSTGKISTVAGTGIPGYNGDGILATSAQLNESTGTFVDASGNIYIADAGNNRIRKVTVSTGIITTVAGTGAYFYNGDGIQATAATLSFPTDVFVSSSYIYIADYNNFRIRRVAIASGIISTVAGTGVYGYNGDGILATSAQIGVPCGVTVSPEGEIFFAEINGDRIRKVNGTGYISTEAGTGTPGFNGDGILSTTGQINGATDVARDPSGRIYVSDQFNNRIRVITSTCPANGGPDKIHQQVCDYTWPGVVIGTPAVPNMNYVWTPSPGGNKPDLSSYTIAQPTSTYKGIGTPKYYTVTVSNANCISAGSSVKVTPMATSYGCKTGSPLLPETSVPTKLSVFPNPCNNNVTLGIHDYAEYIRIMDMQGRVVFETQNISAGEFKLDISNYTKGIYIVTVKIGDIIEKQKLSVE